jgi:hypothetical protein
VFFLKDSAPFRVLTGGSGYFILFRFAQIQWIWAQMDADLTYGLKNRRKSASSICENLRETVFPPAGHE